jgi:UrcA family protein
MVVTASQMEGGVMNVAKLVTTGLFLGVSLLGASSSPAAQNDVPQVAVGYSDLDLTTRDGIAVLHRRIVNAARQVCPAPKNSDLQLKTLARECRAQAIDAAVRFIGNAELAAVHAAGRPRG